MYFASKRRRSPSIGLFPRLTSVISLELFRTPEVVCYRRSATLRRKTESGNPLAHDVSSLFTGGGPISFDIGLAGTANDVGTELSDFSTAALGGAALATLFPALAGATGQSGPNTGANENGVVTNITGDPFAGFANTPAGADLTLFNFNDTSLYSRGWQQSPLQLFQNHLALGYLDWDWLEHLFVAVAVREERPGSAVS